MGRYALVASISGIYTDCPQQICRYVPTEGEKMLKIYSGPGYDNEIVEIDYATTTSTTSSVGIAPLEFFEIVGKWRQTNVHPLYLLEKRPKPTAEQEDSEDPLFLKLYDGRGWVAVEDETTREVMIQFV